MKVSRQTDYREILAELSVAFEGLANSAELAIKRIALQSELDATIAETVQIERAAQALLSIARSIDHSDAVDLVKKSQAQITPPDEVELVPRENEKRVRSLGEEFSPS